MASPKRPLTDPHRPSNNPFAALSSTSLPAAPEPALAPEPATASLGRVVLRREKAQRGGKTVVVITDFAEHITQTSIAEIARDLKRQAGLGGTVRARTIELQGDQPDKVRALLQARGFRVAGP